MANYDFWADRTDKRVRFCEYNNFALANKNFVVSGCEVTSNGTGLDVDIASGEIFINDTKVSVTGANQVLTASDPSQDRCDLIVVNSSGVISKIDGTPGTPPGTPNYTENDYVVLAFVIVEDGVTNLPDADVFNIGLENRSYNESANIMVPVGAVLSWLKSYTNTPSLPTGFVECNGQVLSDAGSVYNGQTIPDLNGNNDILKGDSTSGSTSSTAHNHTLSGITGTTAASYGGGAHGPHTHILSTGVVSAASATENTYTVVWVMRIK